MIVLLICMPQWQPWPEVRRQGVFLIWHKRPPGLGFGGQGSLWPHAGPFPVNEVSQWIVHKCPLALKDELNWVVYGGQRSRSLGPHLSHARGCDISETPWANFFQFCKKHPTRLIDELIPIGWSPKAQRSLWPLLHPLSARHGCGLQHDLLEAYNCELF